MKATSPTRVLNASNLAALTLLLVFVTAATLLYVGQENAFYWSDFNFYQVASRFAKDAFREQPLGLPLLLIVSTKETHNLFFTAPLLPFLLILGDQRWVFVLAMMVAYVVPLSLVMAGVSLQAAERGNDSGSDFRLFWTAVAVAILTPSFVVVALRGYPDYAAALAIMIAVLLYLKDVKLTSRRRLVIIGILLGLAALTRRHYVYADMAFGFSTLLHQIALARMGEARLWPSIGKLVFVGFIAFLFLCTVGFLMMAEIIKHDYLALYTSAYVPFAEGMGYFLTAYGIIAWLFAVGGFAFGLSTKTLDRQKGLFALFFSSSLALVWPLLGKHVAVQYTLYAAPFIVLGITFLFWTIWQRLRGLPRYGALAVLSGCLLFNFFAGIAPEQISNSLPFHPTRFGMLTVPKEEGDAVSRLFSASYPPLVRKDTDEVMRLTDFLREIAPNKEPIFVAGWSDVMMPDVIKNAERRKYGVNDQKLNLLEAPFLDSRDTYPLERLMHSKYVMIANPLRPTYKETSENVLKVVLECFQKQGELSRDFEKMPQTFKLDHDSTITLYKRTRPTTLPVAIRTLEQMKQGIPLRPHAQPLWIATDDLAKTTGDQSKDAFKLSINEGNALSHYLLTCDPLPDSIMISGFIKGNLPAGTFLECTTFDPEGNEIGKDVTKNAIANQSFSIQMSRDRASYLVLFLRNPSLLKSDQPLQVTIEQLKIKGP